MNNAITFYIDGEDRQLVEDTAKKSRLSVSAFCRVKVLDGLYPATDFEKQLSRENQEEAKLKQSLGVSD